MFEWLRNNVDNFSGGITDFYLDAQKNRAERIDNLFLSSEVGQQKRKLVMREGRVLYDAAAPQIPVGNQRINKLIRHPLPEVLAYSSRSVYYKGVGVWSEISGPSLNPALGQGSLASVLSVSDYREHVLLGNDEFSDPMKIYKDQTGTWRVRSASMPAIDTEAAIEIANDLKAKLNAHFADGAQHTSGVDVVDTILTAAAYDEATLIALTTALLTAYDTHESDAELPAAWLYHAAQESADHSLADATAPTTVGDAITKLTDLRTKYNAHDADGVAHAVASSHLVTMGVMPTVSGVAGAVNYLYRLHYTYTYQVGDVTFLDRGPTFEISAPSLTVAAKTVHDIPVIDNGSTRNYDTAGIQVIISRTEGNGTVFYEVGRVTNGTTSFVDTVLDAALVLNEQLYTNSGELDSDPAPACKYLMVVGQRAYYLRVKEGGIEYPNRWRQSKANEVFAAPGSFDDDLDSPITGGSWVGDLPIIFCEDRAYRVEGVIDSSGVGSATAVEIPGHNGCISHSGIVRVPGGVIFPSKGGFWYTNGYQMRPISQGLPDTYEMITATQAKRNRMEGFYDAKFPRVLWQVQMFDASGDVDTTLVMDQTDRITEDMPFYTYSAGFLFPDNWAVTSMLEIDGEIVMSDRRGYILKFDPKKTTDLKIDVLALPSTWTTAAIIFDYRSAGFSGGDAGAKKTSFEVSLVAKNHGFLSVQLGICNDDSGYFKRLKEIRSVSALPWGTAKIPWETSGILWQTARLIEGVRNIPKFFFRWVYKQVQVTNGYTIISASDTFGTVTLNSATKRATLNVGTNSWPTDIVDYDLAFDNDGYAAKYRVKSRISDTVVEVFDPLATLVSSATRKWQLQGYRKGDKLELVAYSFPWAFAGTRLGQYKNNPTGTGKNA